LTAENNPERLVSNNAFVNEIPCRLKKGTSVIKFKIPLGTIWLGFGEFPGCEPRTASILGRFQPRKKGLFFGSCKLLIWQERKWMICPS
jgi:hypothetical protein